MPYFVDITARLNRIKRINQSEMLNNILAEPYVRAYVVDLIKWEQLFKGIDGKGDDLESIGGAYTNYTVMLKQQLPSPYNVIDRVTLLSTGEYYDSLIMVAARGNETLIKVFSDPIKDGVSLEKRWGSHLTELTDENTRKLALELLPLLRKSFLDTWTGKN